MNVQVVVWLTLITQDGIGIMILTSSTCGGYQNLIDQGWRREKEGEREGWGEKEGGREKEREGGREGREEKTELTTFPMVCLGPTLRFILPLPSVKENCGVTYTGRDTILHWGK